MLPLSDLSLVEAVPPIVAQGRTSYAAAFGLGACVLAAAGVIGTLAPETRQAHPQAAAPTAVP